VPAGGVAHTYFTWARFGTSEESQSDSLHSELRRLGQGHYVLENLILNSASGQVQDLRSRSTRPSSTLGGSGFDYAISFKQS
jgi:hypothetical protein